MVAPVLHRESLWRNVFDDGTEKMLNESRSGPLAYRIRAVSGLEFPGLAPV